MIFVSFHLQLTITFSPTTVVGQFKKVVETSFLSGDFGHSDPGCVNRAHLCWLCCSMSWRSAWQLCAHQGRWELRVPGAKGKLEPSGSDGALKLRIGGSAASVIWSTGWLVCSHPTCFISYTGSCWNVEQSFQDSIYKVHMYTALFFVRKTFFSCMFYMSIFVHPILYFDMGCHWFVGYFTRGLAKPWGAGPTVLGEVGRRENLQQRNSGSWAKCSLLDAHQNRLTYYMYICILFIVINIIIYICFMNTLTLPFARNPCW